MNDHAHQAEPERQNMLRRGEGLSRKREESYVPHTPDDLPSLSNDSVQLARLNDLVQGLSQEVRARAGDDQPDTGLDAVRSRAAGILSEAADHYGAVYHQLDFLHAHSRVPEQAPLRNGRHAAFTFAQQRVVDTCEGLSSARASLEDGAALLEEAEAPSLSRAVRARSTHAHHARCQDPADVEAPAKAVAQQPAHTSGTVRGRCPDDGHQRPADRELVLGLRRSGPGCPGRPGRHARLAR
ncbi:hypothetical protein AB0F64_12725 [Streptomyces sp. NPDC026294]|uniref:hypothetical protein n=1 Tax=Streptomyces sp. NPDC026294 TaxID=3155362 RepID=UPI0033FE0D91